MFDYLYACLASIPAPVASPARGTVLVVQHKVRDFSVWKSVFDEREPVRWWHGVRRVGYNGTPSHPDSLLASSIAIG